MLTFDFEKRQELARAEQQKKDALAAEETRQRRIILYAVSAGLGLVLISLLLVYNRFRVTRRQKSIIVAQKAEVEVQRDHVELQKTIIEEKNKSITDSINYAQKIQQAMLPGNAEFLRLLPESFICYRPKDIVSGDFYWITQRGNFFFYVTADCTGHGVPGGFMSVLGASLLNEVVNDQGLEEPAAILEMLRIKIVAALNQRGEGGENKDGMDMVICRIDKTKMELVIAAANNPAWILRNGMITAYGPDKQPVGISGGAEKPFSQWTVGIQSGDIIYTFTDGFADQFGGEKGKKFKYRQLQETLVRISGLQMEAQRLELERVLDEWKGSLEQVDDILLIGVRIS
jgi:serine phosphatase RsbU (regulator of sigma subunit)